MALVWMEREFKVGQETVTKFMPVGRLERRAQRRLPRRRPRQGNFGNTSGLCKTACLKLGGSVWHPNKGLDRSHKRFRRTKWRKEQPSFRLFASLFAAIDMELARA